MQQGVRHAEQPLLLLRLGLSGVQQRLLGFGDLERLRVALNLIKNLACNINFMNHLLELKNYMQH